MIHSRHVRPHDKKIGKDLIYRVQNCNELGGHGINLVGCDQTGLENIRVHFT